MNIVLTTTLFLILVICLFFILRISENFSEVSLYNENLLYNDYRNLIIGRNDLLSKYNSSKRVPPYTISNTCFVQNYNKCRSHNKAVNNLCKEESLNQCVVPNLPVFF